eukprot:UN03522
MGKKSPKKTGCNGIRYASKFGWTVGAEDGDRNPLQGRIFDFAVFKHGLTADEITEFHESSKKRCPIVDKLNIAKKKET